MRTSNSTSVEMQSLSKKHLIFFWILFSLLLCMFLWSYFIFPLITVPPPQSDMYYTTIQDTEHVYLSLFARYIRLLPLLRSIPFHTYSAICPFFFVGGDASLCYIISSSPLLLTLFLSFFFFFLLKYPLSICCSSGPFSPQGSLKLHLVTSTPTLTFFPPPPRLIFLQTLPEVFLPRGSSFLTASPLWCKHFVLGAEKAVQTDGG